MSTAIDVKTTQEGAWIPTPEIDAAEYAREHTPQGLDSLGVDLGKNGQLQNIVLVKKADGRYECIIGNGRLAAARKLGWTHIRADVKEGLSEGQKLVMTLSENSEREDASPFYTADLYNRIMAVEHLSPEQLPDYLGKDRSTIYRVLSIGKLPAEIKSMSQRCDIGYSHLIELAKLPKPEEQVQLAQECAEKDYSVRELQARVKKLLGKPAEAKEETPKVVEPGFRFAWKGKRITVRGSWDADGKGYTVLGMELQDALAEFMLKHPAAPAQEEAPAAA